MGLDVLVQVLVVTLRLSDVETRVVAPALVALDTEGSLWGNSDVVVSRFSKPSSALELLPETTAFSILAIRRGTTVPSEVRTGLLLSPDEELHTSALAATVVEEVDRVFSPSLFVGHWLSET